ncbi:hypothetical protein F511_08718 [Dorcoceras hygrometricum]|uniref:Dystroglycan-like n=1 Tax=Dorcoceras hygrometricum TaxID=472368 RepID=A0A2Z7BRM1_9LAMI|nr:hypothetical protein F511_08718 [Dorcoceras hygrometricum]
MASSFITNALQVNFESVLGISDNDEMVNMFKALESTGLRDFLGCSSVLYEQELEQFFDTALVQDGDITCVVSGKYVAISEDKFAGIFNLPTEGLTDLSEVRNNLVLQERTLFSKLSVPVQFSCKKRLMKYEFRLLNDILAKSITVKAGSFDAVLMMTAIHFGIKVNWSKIIFEVLKEMVDITTKRSKGFAAQICVLLKSDPAVTLGEAKTFPPLKILSAKTVNTYVATNKTIDARGETDEPEVAKVAIVKKKSVSKKRSVSTAINDTAEVQMEIAAPAVKKKRTTTGKAASKKKDLELVSVAPEAVPIQMIEPISAVPAERPPAPKRNALKRKFRMPAGFDDDLVKKEPAVEEPILDQSAGTEKMMELETTAEIDDGVHRIVTSLASRRLAPTSFTRKSALQTVGGGRSSIRSTTGNNLPPTICTRRCDGFLPRTELPRKADRKKSDHPMDGGDATALRRKSGGREVEERRCGRFYALEASVCLAVGPQPLWLRNHNFGLAQRIMVKSLETSPHDPLGITDSACKNQLVVVSVQYGPFNTYIPIRSTTIGKLRVAIDPIAMDTSWRSNSDIANSIGYPRMRASGESSTTKHRLLHASGPPPIPPSNDPNHNQMDSRVHSPMNEKTSANQIDFLVDTPMDGETPVTQISLPAVDPTDVTESFSQLRAYITRLFVNLLKTSSKIGDLHNHLLFKIENLEKAFKEALSNQEQTKEIQALKTDFTDFQLSDVTDIRSQTKEIQALKTDFTDFQQNTESGIAHVSSQLSEIIAYINRGGNDKKGESSSRSPQPPPDDKSRRGGGGSRSRGDRSGYSSIRHSSNSEPLRKDARYWLGQK